MANEERERVRNRRMLAKKAEFVRLVKIDGCPICRTCKQELDRYWFWFFSESYGMGNTVAKYIDYYGFCEKHSLEIAKRGPPWQKSAIYRWIIDNNLPQMEKVLGSLGDLKIFHSRDLLPSRLDLKGSRKKKIASITRTGNCLMCDLVQQTAKDSIKDLMDLLVWDSDIIQAFRNSYGLCMIHFFFAGESIRPEYLSAYREILNVEILRLKQLKSDFEEFFKKGDYHHAGDPKGSEQKTWIRALRRFIGDLDFAEEKLADGVRRQSTDAT